MREERKGFFVLQKLDIRTITRLYACWTFKKSGSRGAGTSNLQTYLLSCQKTLKRGCEVVSILIVEIIIVVLVVVMVAVVVIVVVVVAAVVEVLVVVVVILV